MRILALDCETSGLILNRILPLAKQPEVLDLYMADVDLATGEIIDDWDQLFHPTLQWSEEAEKVHGITQEMVRDCLTFDRYAEGIKKILEERCPNVIAHNAAFDVEILDIAFERVGMHIHFPRIICSVEQTMHLKGYRLSLQELHETLFGAKFKEAHRAKSDTQALIRCAVKLYQEGVLS
jgi:DNA polymerase III alpha subunit (gram-positive type)